VLFQPYRGLVHEAAADPHDPWVPMQLASGDLDWSKSRPRKPWPPRGTFRDPLYSQSEWLNRWLVTLLELRTCDVTNVLCAGVSEVRGQRPATVRDQSLAIRALADYLLLPGNKDLPKADALKWCRSQGLSLSGRGFQQRVWPRAREKAQLEPLARPGRKRTLLR
jgi:hypothetical protein